MKKAPLLIQVLLINAFVFLLMGVFGYYLVIPTIEKPYVEEVYTQIEFQLNELKTSTEFHPDRRYIYLRYTNATEILQYVNNFPNSEYTVALAEIIPELVATTTIQSDSLVHINTLTETETTLLYAYVQDDTYLYLVATPGDLNPILNDPELWNRIIATALIAFFMPVVAVLIWSLFISTSIQSVNRRLQMGRRHKKPLLLAREIDTLYTGIVNYEQKISDNEAQKQVLFQSISHELKTPIAAIQSHAEAIEDGVLSPEQVKVSSKVIQDKTRTLLDMVNQIMQLNRVTYLEQHLTPEIQASLVNLSDVLFELMNRYQKDYPNVQFDAHLEPILFRGDKVTWKTVLGNIFDNNIRHGATNIKLTIQEDMIAIDNNGELIPEDLLKQLFKPFSKGEKGSFGLGLTIIQKALLPFRYGIRIDNIEQGVRYTIEARAD